MRWIITVAVLLLLVSLSAGVSIAPDAWRLSPDQTVEIFRHVDTLRVGCLIFSCDTDPFLRFSAGDSWLMTRHPQPGRWFVYVQRGTTLLLIESAGGDRLSARLSDYGMTRLEGGDAWLFNLQVTEESVTVAPGSAPPPEPPPAPAATEPVTPEEEDKEKLYEIINAYRRPGAPAVTRESFQDKIVEHLDDDMGYFDQAPEPLKKVQPQRTLAQVRKGISGRIILKVEVLENGSVNHVLLEQCVDPELDQQAISAARQWVFAPALLKGKPVTAWYRITFLFN